MGLSVNELVIPKVYAPLFKNDYKRFILSSGRISGKSSILVYLWWYYINKYPNDDIVFLQATSAEIKDSIINEIYQFLYNSDFDVGHEPNRKYCIPKAHDKVIINDGRSNRGQTYFYPITDSKGGQRSRGVKTTHKISLVLYEEAQKNANANIIEQSMATFVRQLDSGVGKIVIVGNSETVGHWFVDFVAEKRKSDEWLYIYACYKDIYDLLNEETKKHIEEFSKTNPVEYRRIYLGDIKAATSANVFPQFVRANNYKLIKDIPEKYIRYIIFGVDHATANDDFAIVPVAILEDGTTQTLEVCYDSPDETQRSLSPSEQCDLLEAFVEWIDKKYGIVYNQIPCLISIDGAAATFKTQVLHTKKVSKNKPLWKRIMVKGFTMKKKDVNLGIIKNAFAYGVLTILNEGYYNWEGNKNTHKLCHQIEAQRYKNGKLDPYIPNDLVDALEYGLIPYYTNCYNISFPVRYKNYKESHYEEIQKIANIMGGKIRNYSQIGGNING